MTRKMTSLFEQQSDIKTHSFAFDWNLEFQAKFCNYQIDLLQTDCSKPKGKGSPSYLVRNVFLNDAGVLLALLVVVDTDEKDVA